MPIGEIGSFNIRTPTKEGGVREIYVGASINPAFIALIVSAVSGGKTSPLEVLQLMVALEHGMDSLEKMGVFDDQPEENEEGITPAEVELEVPQLQERGPPRHTVWDGLNRRRQDKLTREFAKRYGVQASMSRQLLKQMPEDMLEEIIGGRWPETVEQVEPVAPEATPPPSPDQPNDPEPTD